jgi:hypothetical protein
MSFSPNVLNPNKLAMQLLQMQLLVMQLLGVLGVGIVVSCGGVVIGAGRGPLRNHIAHLIYTIPYAVTSLPYAVTSLTILHHSKILTLTIFSNGLWVLGHEYLIQL